MSVYPNTRELGFDFFKDIKNHAQIQPESLDSKVKDEIKQ